MEVTPNTGTEVLELLEHLQQAESPRIYVMQRTGPTSFTVREETCDVNRKVTIGCRPTCSCSSSAGCKELCLHIVFVMVRVLRVPPSNPLTWQLALTDRELEQVLRYSVLPQQPPPSVPDEPRRAVQEKGAVTRKPVDEEEPCPICYEEMAGCQLEHLVWCKHGCGRNIHGKCMSVWSNHQLCSLGKELTCPLCRADWGPFLWKPPPNKPRKTSREPRQDVHYGTRCGGCRKAPLTGKRHKCLICADYDLCSECFDGGTHPQHPFACRETPTSYAVPSERAAMMPMVTRLGVAAMAVTAGPPLALTLVRSGEQAVGSSGGEDSEGGAGVAPAPAAAETQQAPPPPVARAPRSRRRSSMAQAAAAAAEARLAAAMAAAAAAAAMEQGHVGVGGVGVLPVAALGNEVLGGVTPHGVLTPVPERTQRPQHGSPSARPQGVPRRRSSSAAGAGPSGAAAELAVGSSALAAGPNGRAGGGASTSAPAARVHRGLAGQSPLGRGQAPAAGRGREAADHRDLGVILESHGLGSQPQHDGSGARGAALAAHPATAAAAAVAGGRGGGSGSSPLHLGVHGLLVQRGGGAGAGSAAAPGPHAVLSPLTQEQQAAYGVHGRARGQRSSSRPAARARPPLPAPAAAAGHVLDAFHLDGHSVAPRTLATTSPPRSHAAPPLTTADFAQQAVEAELGVGRSRSRPSPAQPPREAGAEALRQQQEARGSEAAMQADQRREQWGQQQDVDDAWMHGPARSPPGTPMNETQHQGALHAADGARAQQQPRHTSGHAASSLNPKAPLHEPAAGAPPLPRRRRQSDADCPGPEEAGVRVMNSAVSLWTSTSSAGSMGVHAEGTSAGGMGLSAALLLRRSVSARAHPSTAEAASSTAAVAEGARSSATVAEPAPSTSVAAVAALSTSGVAEAAPSTAQADDAALSARLADPAPSRTPAAVGTSAAAAACSTASLGAELDREALIESRASVASVSTGSDDGLVGGGGGAAVPRPELELDSAAAGLAPPPEWVHAAEARHCSQGGGDVLVCGAPRRSFEAGDDVLLASVIGLGDALLGRAAGGGEAGSGPAGAAAFDPSDPALDTAGWKLFSNPVYNTSWTPSSSIAV